MILSQHKRTMSVAERIAVVERWAILGNFRLIVEAAAVETMAAMDSAEADWSLRFEPKLGWTTERLAVWAFERMTGADGGVAESLLVGSERHAAVVIVGLAALGVRQGIARWEERAAA